MKEIKLLNKVKEMLEDAESAEVIAWKNMRITAAMMAHGRVIAYRAVIDLIEKYQEG